MLGPILTFLRHAIDVLKSAPAVIMAVVELVKLAQGLFKRFGKKKEISQAVETAKETKDTSSLESVLFETDGDLDVTFVEPEKTGLEDLVGPAETTEVAQEEKKSPDDIVFSEIKFEEFEAKPEEVVASSLVSDIASGVGKAFKTAFNFGNQDSSTGLGESFVVNTHINYTTRMGSKFFSVIACLFIFLGCSTNKKQEMVHVKIYAGDASKSAIVRRQSNEQILTNSPEFNDFMCIKYDTVEAYFNRQNE